LTEEFAGVLDGRTYMDPDERRRNLRRAVTLIYYRVNFSQLMGKG